MSSASPLRPSDIAVYVRVLRHARSYWPHLLAIFLLRLTSAPLALLTPLPLKMAVDSVIGDHPLPPGLRSLVPAVVETSDAGLLAFAALLLVAITVMGQVQALASNLLKTYTGQKLLLSFRAHLLRHAQRLSLSYHDHAGTFDTAYRIQYDATAIQSVAMDGVTPVMTAAITLASMVYIILRLDWQLGVVALAVLPALSLLSQAYRRPLKQRSHQTKQLESLALNVVQEVLGAVRVVKAFGQEEREEQRFVRRSLDSIRARIRLTAVEAAFGLLIGVATAGGTAAVLLLGVRHVQSGLMTLGDLLLIMAYLAQVYAPLKTLSNAPAKFASALASAERAFALLDQTPEVLERAQPRRLARARGAVAFRYVSFSYETDRKVLDGISFEIDPGARLGIAGMTGAGKTTLVNLLTRFYDPSEGAIVLDGVDLRDYRLADLRGQFAIVLQEPVLFSTTIAENIAYARPAASQDEIIWAARAANAHEFIRHFPHGYDTLVGERGMRLSGGERQRISLARAFLKDAPILILDEPTSSVDVRVEALIIEAMEQLMRGRTTLLISHRVTLLEKCDRLLVMENGRVARMTSDVAGAIREVLAHPS